MSPVDFFAKVAHRIFRSVELFHRLDTTNEEIQKKQKQKKMKEGKRRTEGTIHSLALQISNREPVQEAERARGGERGKERSAATPERGDAETGRDSCIHLLTSFASTINLPSLTRDRSRRRERGGLSTQLQSFSRRKKHGPFDRVTTHADHARFHLGTQLLNMKPKRLEI